MFPISVFFKKKKSLIVSLKEESIGRVFSRGDNTSWPNLEDITTEELAKENYTTITIIQHSNEATFKKDRQIGGQNAEKIANKIIRLYEHHDKNTLLHLNLLSCEAGLSVNGECLAEQIAKKLNAQGFKNVEVHAIAPPKLNPPATGMIVETDDNSKGKKDKEPRVSAWCYRTPQDEEKDNRLYLCYNTPYSKAFSYNSMIDFFVIDNLTTLSIAH